MYLGLFAQLGQNAACAFGMQESNVQALGTFARSLVDEADAFLVAFSQRVGHAVLNAESHMMHTLVAFVKPLLYGALG